jgi:hypothetical protein
MRCLLLLLDISMAFQLGLGVRLSTLYFSFYDCGVEERLGSLLR